MYIVPGEAPHTRSTGHKSHILKVMFLAAIARPRYDGAGNCTFDGKIGMWPFVESVVAQRGSVHCPSGTIKTKPVSVMAETKKQFLTGKVIPVIKGKWPDRDCYIFIQQDGASSHIRKLDPDFVAAVSTGTWNIQTINQPAQSPDTSQLDLIFFRALQEKQWDHDGYAWNTDGLIAQVTLAFAYFD